MKQIHLFKNILVVFVVSLFVAACYTQLALVQRDVYIDDDDYYYREDTLQYQEDDQNIQVREYYYYDRPDYYNRYWTNDPWFWNDYNFHFGCYTSWYPYHYGWPYNYSPYWWYDRPLVIIFDGDYWDYYGWGYWRDSRHFGPRPFDRDGHSSSRGGSSRVTLGPRDTRLGEFGATRMIGNNSDNSLTRQAVRKSSRTEIGNEQDTRAVRSSGGDYTTRRDSKSSTADNDKKTVRKKGERRYYPLTPAGRERNKEKVEARQSNRSNESSKSEKSNRTSRSSGDSNRSTSKSSDNSSSKSSDASNRSSVKSSDNSSSRSNVSSSSSSSSSSRSGNSSSSSSGRSSSSSSSGKSSRRH